MELDDFDRVAPLLAGAGSTATREAQELLERCLSKLMTFSYSSMVISCHFNGF